MSDVTIYHNPRCSKSRNTLELIRGKGTEPTVVEYLKNPPSAGQIKGWLKALGMAPRDLMRKKEDEYGDLGLADTSLSDDALIQAMVENPRLIERPVVTNGDKVALGRPPENVLEIL